MLPNDVFKRPGPHHAFELDLAQLAAVRGALEALESLGDAAPLAALMPYGATAEEIAGGAFYETVWCVVLGEDFGLKRYGPMWSRAGLAVTWGEALYEAKDSRVHPVSWVWAEHEPYLPYFVAPASDVLAALGELESPPDHAWTELAAMMVDEDALLDADDPDAERATQAAETAARIAEWRRESTAELAAFTAQLSALAARGAWIVAWESEQGWL